MTHGELLGRMTSRELSEWQAYFILENEDRETERLSSSARAGAKERMRR